MLRYLSVKRLAVIQSVEVEFEAGLNVLTGETGAGKSILVGAVGLLLGGRASGDMVRTGEEFAVIEAVFESGGEEVLVRREVTAQGRSRAFVDGQLATAGALKALAERLIELHGQHEHQTLLDPSTHLDALDTFGGLQPLLTPTGEAFHAWRAAAASLGDLRRSSADRDARQEFAAFQLAELDRAMLRAGEDDDLAATRQILASAERVERLCDESYASLYERDSAVLSELGGVWRRVGELAALDPQFQPYLDARDTIKSQLEDLALFLRHYRDTVDAAPARLQEIEERLALLERLKRRHGPTLADVIARRDALRNELEDLNQNDDRVSDLEQQVVRHRGAYIEAAERLSQARRAAASVFGTRMESLLAELAMDRTRFEVRFDATSEGESAWSTTGVDRLEFVVSPNPGEELRPLARIVSGGELSRIMLAMKTLTFGNRLANAGTSNRGGERARGAGAPGLIFDEVDAGIGGRVADVVGHKLKELGTAFQVLCITHLPQIAARADAHFHIAKHVEGGRTQTTVVRLEGEARVEEVGRMLAGHGITEAVRTSARELLAAKAGAKDEYNTKGESESQPVAKPRTTASSARKSR